MGPGQGERAELHLPHGVSVWLCAAHGSLEFQRKRSGRDFEVTVGWAWGAAGCLTVRRRRALAAHRTRLVGAPAERGRPGSYSWPALRREAERRAAGGEAPAAVIRSVRALAGGGAAVPPSARTVRRWIAEGRWLAEGHDVHGSGPRPGGDAPRDDRRSLTSSAPVASSAGARREQEGDRRRRSSPTWASRSPSSSASSSPARRRCSPSAIHSVADTGNQGLLVLGGRTGRRGAARRSTPSATAASATSGPSWSRWCSSPLGSAVRHLRGRSRSSRHPHELDVARPWRSGILGVAHRARDLLAAHRGARGQPEPGGRVVVGVHPAVQEPRAAGGAAGGPRRPAGPGRSRSSGVGLAVVTGEPRFDGVGDPRHRRSSSG